MTGETTPIGSIHVAPRAVATIAFQAALQSYGVVGLAPKNLINGLTNVLVKDPTQGIEVTYNSQNINIDIYIVIEYGTRTIATTRSVFSTDRFVNGLRRGLRGYQVNVHVS